MVELSRHEPIPASLADYNRNCPCAGPQEFKANRHPVPQVKADIKAAMNRDQGGLCVYCERTLAPTEGEVEHVLPKSRHPNKTFDFSNLAHACGRMQVCGNKKADKELPIVPAPGCNDDFFLGTGGNLEPRVGLSRQRRHEVCSTRDMVGLNEAQLVNDRKKWVDAVVAMLKADSSVALDVVIKDSPFRHILKRLVA